MIVGLREVGSAQEHDDVGFLSDSLGTGYHLVGGLLIDGGRGDAHKERTGSLDSGNQLFVGIEEMEVLVVAYVALCATELHVEVVRALQRGLQGCIQILGNLHPLGPAACVLVVNGKERRIVLVVQDEANGTHTCVLRTARHLELGAAHLAEIDILIEEDVARSGILQVARTLVITGSAALGNHGFREGHSAEVARHQ